MWEVKKPVYGDQIRVNRGLYAHHGIYASDDCVIHFAAKDANNELDPSKAKIITTSLADFLKGGVCEVRCYTKEELAKKRSPQDIVNYAMSCLGRGGYNLVTNNCEHFSNECAFGEKISDQVSNILKLFGGN